MSANVFNITGVYNLVADPNWKNLPSGEIRLECDPTLGPVTINLPKISDLEGFYNIKYFVIDKTNMAGTNNITVNAAGGNTIDGAAALVLNANGAGAEIQIVSNTQMLSFESNGLTSTNVPSSGLLVVDSGLGNDATAQIGNMAKPYQTIDAAVAAAPVGATIQLNSGTYASFANLLQKSLSYQLAKGASLIAAGLNTCSVAGESYKFTGEGVLQLSSNFTFDLAFDGSLTIDVGTLVFSAYIYIDNATYYAAPTAPNQVTLKANTAISNNGTLTALYAGVVSMNVDFEKYTSSIVFGTADFWNTGAGVYAFDVNSYINIGSANLSVAAGSPSPFFRMVSGTPNTRTYITGTYTYSNTVGAAARPTLINPDSTTATIFFNGTAMLTNASMLLDFGTGRVKIEGKVYITDNTGVANTLLDGYFTGESIVQISADTIYDSANNAAVSANAGAGTGQLEISNCKIANTNAVPAAGTVVLTAVGVVRMANTIVTNAVASITAPAPITIQAYYVTTDTAPVNVTSTFVAIPIVTDPLVTVSNF